MLSILNKSLRSMNINACANAIWEIARSTMTQRPYFEYLKETLFLLFDERWEIRAKARMCVYVLIEAAIRNNLETMPDRELYEICSYGHQYATSPFDKKIIKRLSSKLDDKDLVGYAATYALSRLRSEETLTLIEELLSPKQPLLRRLRGMYLLSQFILPSELLTYTALTTLNIGESNRIWPKELDELRDKSSQESQQNKITDSNIQKIRDKIPSELNTIVETELVNYLRDWDKRSLIVQMIDCISKNGASVEEWRTLFKLEFGLSKNAGKISELSDSISSSFYNLDDSSDKTTKRIFLSFGSAILASRMNVNFSSPDSKRLKMGNFYNAFESLLEGDLEDIKAGLLQADAFAPMATVSDKNLARGFMKTLDPLSEPSGSLGIPPDKMFKILVGRNFSSKSIGSIKRIIREGSGSLKTQAFKVIKLFKLEECKEELIHFLNSELRKKSNRFLPKEELIHFLNSELRKKSNRFPSMENLTDDERKKLITQVAEALMKTLLGKDSSRIEAMAALNRLSDDENRKKKKIIILCLALPEPEEKIIAMRIISMNNWATDCIDQMVDEFLLSDKSEYINHATEALKKITDPKTLSRLGKKLEDIPIEKWNEDSKERGIELQEHIASRTGERFRLSFIT